jgi:hypothetical protein
MNGWSAPTARIEGFTRSQLQNPASAGFCSWRERLNNGPFAYLLNLGANMNK